VCEISGLLDRQHATPTERDPARIAGGHAASASTSAPLEPAPLPDETGWASAAMMAGTIRLSTVALVLASCGGPPAAAVEAFPGAQGFGAGARGGRGGEVHEVVNLNDAGPGTLRACVEASGPRTCVFRVGGTIAVSSPIVARAPYLTIAGQTAPGDGIALRLARAPLRPGSPLVIADVHDVVIRHIRLRPGPGSERASTDALLIHNSHDVIVDHASMSWAPDENLGMGGAVRNVTAQWSIMAEGLYPHSKGTLACSVGWKCTNIALHHNLYVSNRDRNPELNGAAVGHIDVVNNVIHNPKSEYVEVWASWGGTLANVEGNTFRKGPNTNGWAHGLRYHDVGARGFPRVYVADNASEVTLLAPGTAPHVVTRPVAPLSVAAESAAAAYEKVLARAGAWPRDAVDARLVAEVRDRSGRIISHPIEVFGWPELASGAAPPDADHDGMSDDWERAHGLDPGDPADRNVDQDRDGYTNLEEYLDELAASLVTGPASEAVSGQK
jgi:pectate lyase